MNDFLKKNSERRDDMDRNKEFIFDSLIQGLDKSV